MPNDIFDTAVSFVLIEEGNGRVSDNPADPGGLTRWGISQRAYPDLDIRNLSRAQATEIYRRDYWEAGRCDDLPAGIAVVHFDACVNQGVPAAAKLLQQSVQVAADGVIGARTLAAVRAAGQRWLILEYAARRGCRYGLGQTFRTFGLGWMRRLFRCAALALDVARTGGADAGAAGDAVTVGGEG